MTDISGKIELLAPAGNPDSLTAAVASGADALYLGLDRFNARSSADNFTNDNLADYIDYCHLRGVRVYLALNTVLYDDEIQAAYETACFAYNSGIDAVILQDMGLLSVLHKEIPGLELHASTQVSINSKAGALQMGELGFSRVILAREMVLQTIREASSSDITTEVFVHGARCYSYSGQCLMSSLLGGRSGNRGNCAQPCRLPYDISDGNANTLLKGHLLSLKDTMYIDSLNLLKDAGVGALKIEGRMKTPSYVAAVVSIYRKYLDMSGEYKISKDDLDDLMKSFNREGFSKGALSAKKGFNEFSRSSPANSGFPVGKVIKSDETGSVIEFVTNVDHNDGLKLNSDGSYAGKDISSLKREFFPLYGNPGDIVYRTKDIAFNNKYALRKILAATRKVPLKAKAAVVLGNRLSLSLSDDTGNECQVLSPAIPEPAKSGGTSRQRIEDQLKKTGGTPFEITDMEMECEDGIYVGISDINDLRRMAIEEISGLRTKNNRKAIPHKLTLPIARGYVPEEVRYSVCLYNIPEKLDFSQLDADRVYVDAVNCRSRLPEIAEKCKENSIGFFLLIPYSYETVPEIPCDGYLIGNHGMFRKLPHANLVLDTGFNITNSYSITKYKNVESFTLSYEMTQERVKSFINNSEAFSEMVVYGKPQVMESPYCPARDICSGDLCIKKELHLTDRKGVEWEVIYDPFKHGVRIFNPHRLMLTESIPFIKDSGIKSFRINIIDETAAEIYEILRAAKTGTRPRLNPEYIYTRGHY